VLSCDLQTDIPPHVVMNPHRTLNNTLTCFFFDASNLEPAERLNKEQGEIVGLDPSTCTLLMSIPRADVVDDEINIRRSLLTK
jgi:translation initiation factor eIF-2B subunit gamma